MLELAVPWKEWIKEANNRKREKYQVVECRGRGWRTLYEPIQLDCRGSLYKVLGQLGVTGTANLQVKLQRKPQGCFGLRGLVECYTGMQIRA